MSTNENELMQLKDKSRSSLQETECTRNHAHDHHRAHLCTTESMKSKQVRGREAGERVGGGGVRGLDKFSCV
jgi:hypothetical protein